MAEAVQCHILNKHSHFPLSHFFPGLSISFQVWVAVATIEEALQVKSPWRMGPIVTKVRAAHYPAHSTVLPPPFPFLLGAPPKCSLLAKVLWREKCWSRPLSCATAADMFGAER